MRGSHRRMRDMGCMRVLDAGVCAEARHLLQDPGLLLCEQRKASTPTLPASICLAQGTCALQVLPALC